MAKLKQNSGGDLVIMGSGRLIRSLLASGLIVVARFCASLFGAGRRFDLVPTRANGQPAFGAYLRARTGSRHGTGLYVLTLSGDQISAMTRQQRAPSVR